jgi:ribonuclease HII
MDVPKQEELFGEIPMDQRWGELWARASGYNLIAGVDEAGRGCLAGPVVAAAVMLDHDHGIEGLADSKRLSPAARERLFPEIISRSHCAAAMVPSGRIDRINILAATMEAMAACTRRLCAGPGGRPDCILVDGPHVPRSTVADGGVLYIPVKHGDSLSENIAAASIVAKVLRDRLMRLYDTRHAGYGFSRHKGYGTAEHLGALRRLGPCPIHRLTFAGVGRSA